MPTMGALGLVAALAPTAVLPKGTAPFGGGLAATVPSGGAVSAADAAPLPATGTLRPTRRTNTRAPKARRTPTILTAPRRPVLSSGHPVHSLIASISRR